jgi:hypothetical protein
MKISDKITERLARIITGDIGSAPNLSGSKLVEFYNEFGFNDSYGPGFPSRWVYSKDKIDSCNGTTILKTIIEQFVDPRRYFGDDSLTETIVSDINQLIKYDGYVLTKNGSFYKIAQIEGCIIDSNTISSIGHDFVIEQIAKCNHKITSGDFNGAITNARTLCEAILIHVIETIEMKEVKNDGDIIKLWSRAKKVLKLDKEKDEIPEYVYQILSGLQSIINGLAGISNNAGDRHANKFNTKKHHAKIAVNSTVTFCDFLIEVLINRRLHDSN